MFRCQFGLARITSLGCAALLSACGSGSDSQKRDPSKMPTQVGFVVARLDNVPLVTELSGRVTAFQIAEVRPQVAGIVRKRFYTEGSLVRQGQTLYSIDPRLYRAASAEAQANLDSAVANAQAAQQRAARFRPLAEMEAISRQDYTDATAQARAAAASVAQTRAALDTARINLRFTDVPAPISGRIGRSLITVGALVTVNQADPLAVIQRLDPVFVDIQQPGAAVLALRRALSANGMAPTTAVVRLTLEDGSEYGETGTVEFAESIVDAGTDTVTLRARFDNPQNLLLPGMFVRAKFAQAVQAQAILVPQQAVSRTPTGKASVFIVGPGNKAVVRNVTATRVVGANWVVSEGLKPGDRIVTQGTGALRPGSLLRPVPATSPMRPIAPKAGAG